MTLSVIAQQWLGGTETRRGRHRNRKTNFLDAGTGRKLENKTDIVPGHGERDVYYELLLFA